MRRSICIPVEQYNKMMESYDEAIEELRDLRHQLQAIRYGRAEDEVAPVQEQEAGDV